MMAIARKNVRQPYVVDPLETRLRYVTNSQQRGRAALLALVLAVASVVLGLTFLAGSPASATPSPSAPAVSDNSIDTSDLVQSHGNPDKGKKGDCEGDSRCTPIQWCDGKVIEGAPTGKALIESGQPKPNCLKVPTASIDDKDCCQAPPGGTISIKIHNPNDVAVPVQVTVSYEGQEHTKSGWAKPGNSVVKLKKLANGKYGVKVHLFDCVFGQKWIVIKCETASPSPSASTSGSPSPSESVSASPSESQSSSAPAGGTGGGDTSGGQLALTGSNTSTIAIGGGLLVLLGVAVLLGSLRYRRRRSVFVSE